MKYFLTHLTEVKLPMAILLSVIGIASWIPSFIEQPIDSIICFLLTIGNAALLMHICYCSNINRIHSIFPILMYFLPISALPFLQTQWMQQIYVSIYLVIFFILVKIYRKENAVEESFLITLLLAIGVLFHADLIWFLPLIWFCFYMQQAFNHKVILSSLIAIALVFIIFFSLKYLPLNLDINIQADYILSHSFIFSSAISNNIALLSVCCLTLVFLACSLINFSRATASNQSFIIIIITTAIPAIILTLLYNNYFFPMTTLTILCIAGFSSYIFQKDTSLVKGVSFLAYLLILLASRILYFAYF